MKGNRYVRQVHGSGDLWCDYCRCFIPDTPASLKQHSHARAKLPRGTETVTTNERLLEIIRASC